MVTDVHICYKTIQQSATVSYSMSITKKNPSTAVLHSSEYKTAKTHKQTSIKKQVQRCVLRRGLKMLISAMR